MRLFYSSDYVLASHEFDTTRKAKWIADSLRADPIAGVELEIPMPLFEDEIADVHSLEYIKAVQISYPLDLAESQGFKWCRDLWNMVCASNGGVVTAATMALHEGVSGSLSSGLHHARRDRGDGFCTFNGLAIASHLVHQRVIGAKHARRILILDLDAHCGGGTFELLGKRSWITIADISVDDYDRYLIPPNCGRHSLEIVQDGQLYLETIGRRLSALARQHGGSPFELCLYNAGMDPFEGNTRHGGLKGVTLDILRAREDMVFTWCKEHRIPVAFVLAGGYADDEASRKELVALHRLTIESAVRIA